MGKEATTVEFGTITLPISARTTPFKPELIPYAENQDVLANIAYAVFENMPVLLIGETGVGKTSAIRHIAAKTNHGLRRVNVNGSMTAEDFVGQLLVNAKGTYWKDGVLTEAMRNGYWLVIDEINAASAEILFVLHSLLDDDRYIVLTEHPEREIVRPHEDFRIFATMNPPERYAGTKEMNKALLSRFPVTLTVEIPPEEVEYGILSHAARDLDSKKLIQLQEFTNEVRAAYQKEEMDVFMSPRDTAHIVRVFKHTKSMEDAIRMTLVPRGTRAEQKVIIDMARLRFGDARGVTRPTSRKKVEEKEAKATF